MDKTYSFVIPHHNTPDLLQRLIDTIPQREDIEIIVVDDNSDEDKKAAVKRPDVKTIFIDKEHTKGAGRARNVGMDAATGKWLLFADADDLYKPGFIDVLDEYKDSDLEILFFNVDSIDSDTLEFGLDRTKLEQILTTGYDGSEEAKDKLLFLRWGPWRKMLNRNYTKKYNFQYEEIPNGNDVQFSLLTSYFAKKWKVDKRVLYTLTFRKGSITFSKLTKRKYSTTLANLRKREVFMKYIGHSDWMSSLRRRSYLNTLPLYIIGHIRSSPLKGLEILWYYLCHFYEIERVSHCYVDMVKDIDSKIYR